MPDTFAITIVFIILSTVVAAFIRRKSRDKCLKDFSHDLVTLEDTTGKLIWGKLRVENTGLELIYPTRQDKNGHDETSYILYKYEYSNIQALIRYHDELSERGKKIEDIQAEIEFGETDPVSGFFQQITVKLDLYLSILLFVCGMKVN